MYPGAVLSSYARGQRVHLLGLNYENRRVLLDFGWAAELSSDVFAPHLSKLVPTVRPQFHGVCLLGASDPHHSEKAISGQGRRPVMFGKFPVS